MTIVPVIILFGESAVMGLATLDLNCGQEASGSSSLTSSIALIVELTCE